MDARLYHSVLRGCKQPREIFFGATFCQDQNPTLPPTQFFFGRAPHSLSPTADKKFLKARLLSDFPLKPNPHT